MIAEQVSPEFIKLMVYVIAGVVAVLAIVVLIGVLLEYKTRKDLSARHRKHQGCACNGVKFKPWASECEASKVIGRYICTTCGRTIG